MNIKYADCEASVVINHAKLICFLYSFYSQKNIEYSICKVYTANSLRIEVREVEVNSFDDEHGVFMWDFFRNPLNLILNIDVAKSIANLEFVELLVKRYNHALQVDGESRFMILYNLLERLRNKYILDSGNKLKKVIEEYPFTCSKSERDRLIKYSLEGLVHYVHEDYQTVFKNEINYKINPIKLMSMSNQFQSFFDYIDIDPSNQGLDFIRLKSLRDTIFHGNVLGANNEYLVKINKYNAFPRFVGIVIMKFLGIEDISAIQRKKSIVHD